ncbi:hypothetical protein COL65_20330 [Priestia aryabhattai]|uniref:hypothetical protein n=1 Tax=Priestia aryabhattai TaxID=412384 RepID=UPI000BF664E3|nr:hypothetical protein [Priestia aryabhattai]PGA16240.1 hypothetical protein COL65_20330 [Priestia aryabhattai]
MKNNFLNNVHFEQEVLVFDDYNVLEEVDLLNSYPFDSYSSTPDLHYVNHWKKILKKQFVSEKNFHGDLLYRSSKSNIEKWAKYTNISVDELLKILEKNNLKEKESNQIEEDKDYYEMKSESPFNESSILGVTPDAMQNLSKKYKLQEASSLYTELAKLEVFDFNSLLRFSKHFGMPSGLMDDIGFDIELDGNCLFFPFTSISVLNKKIAIYKQDFEWFKVIQTKNATKIRSMIPESDLILINNVDENEAVVNYAKHHLTLLLGRLDAFNVSMHVEFQNGSFVPGVWFSDLFNFAYFQIAKALSNNVEVRECDNCGYIFEVTHKRQRFCPPLPHRKRSSCEMAYNNRLKREKKLKGEI